MVESTWESRELPILRALVEAFDESVVPIRMDVESVAQATGLSEDDVKRGLRALVSAAEPYLVIPTGSGSLSQPSIPTTISGVTERARRAVGQWPTPEALAERLVAALEAAAEREPDQERQGWLRGLARFAAGAGRDIFTGAVGGALGNAF